MKIFGREASEMSVARQFGEKIICAQQNETRVFPRAVLAAVMLQTKGKPQPIGKELTEVASLT